jgi:hypothetical protein
MLVGGPVDSEKIKNLYISSVQVKIEITLNLGDTFYSYNLHYNISWVFEHRDLNVAFD